LCGRLVIGEMDKLKGKNEIGRFKQIAEKLCSQLSSIEGVVGIVFMGGLARGFADRFSDVDIDVYLSKKDRKSRETIRKMGADEQKRSGIDVDLSTYFIDEFGKRRWTEIERWDYSHALIVHDLKGEVRRIFDWKLAVSRDFWVKRIATCAEYLKWYCCSPAENVGTMAEAWVERGDFASAHYCLTYAVDVLLRVIFALNREFVPPQKWRIFYSYILKWLPSNYEELLREAMVIKEFSTSDLERRLKAIRKIWRGTVPKIEEETGLTLEKLSKYYVENVLRQG
jgi:predicted nucleotidyltransferase